MVKKTNPHNLTIFLCEECKFGYTPKKDAQKCEQYCKTHKSCSLEITKRAIYHL